MLPGTPRGNLTRNEAKERIYAFRYLFNNPQGYAKQDSPGMVVVGGVMSKEVLQSTCKDPACPVSMMKSEPEANKGSCVTELV